MYDGIAILKSNPIVTYDNYGNEEVTYTDKQVYVIPRGVYHSEFYSAAQLGIMPSLTLIISNRLDYDGEKIVEYEGVLYDVIRTDWTAKSDEISLTLAERIGTADDNGGSV